MFGCFVTAVSNVVNLQPYKDAVLRHNDALGSEVLIDDNGRMYCSGWKWLDFCHIGSSQRENGVVVREATTTVTIARLVFTERLGNTSWCSSTKCTPMPRTVKCYCCRKVAEVEEQLEGGDSCVTALKAFQRVCLDKDVLYTSLVTMHTVRGDEVKLPLSNRWEFKSIAENNNLLRYLLDHIG